MHMTLFSYYHRQSRLIVCALFSYYHRFFTLLHFVCICEFFKRKVHFSAIFTLQRRTEHVKVLPTNFLKPASGLSGAQCRTRVSPISKPNTALLLAVTGSTKQLPRRLRRGGPVGPGNCFDRSGPDCSFDSARTNTGPDCCYGRRALFDIMAVRLAGISIFTIDIDIRCYIDIRSFNQTKPLPKPVRKLL